MGSIVFFGTEDLDRLKRFYQDEIGMKIWLDQSDCCIFKYYNMLLGFCRKDKSDLSGVITIFCRSKEDVDHFYLRFSPIASTEPKENPHYRIYNFFAFDPDGRTLEFQCFLHHLEPWLDGMTLLKSRRSIRSFSKEEVSMDIIYKIMEICRYSPTSRNTQGYYYLFIKDRDKINYLASLRGPSSEPISRAPLAVAVCADPSKTARAGDDGIIASYHLMLASALHGLGTCWIAAMNTDKAKECLGIPKEHYIATITPLGYPAVIPETPARKEKESFFRIIG